MDKEEFAAERSHRDSQQAGEFGKTLCQMLLGINGLATTALIAYCGTHDPAVRIPDTALLVSTSCFVAGVIFAVLANFAFLKMTEEWATRWKHVAHGNEDAAEKQVTKAMKLREQSRTWVWFSVVAFAIGAASLGVLTIANQTRIRHQETKRVTVSVVAGLTFACATQAPPSKSRKPSSMEFSVPANGTC
jgi:hypothetical protein